MTEYPLQAILEALLFMSPDPLTPSELKKLIKNGRREESTPAEGEPLFQEETTGVEPAIEKVETESFLDSPEPANGDESADPLDQILQKQAQLEEEISAADIRKVLEEMMVAYQQDPLKGFELVEVAKGFQFRTKVELAPYVRGLYKLPKPRLSPPALETLSLVAYQQPVTKAKIEEVRGVESGGVLKTLLDRELVRIVGRSEEPGKPVLYGTTKKFLEIFSLASLSELPTLKDLESQTGSFIPQDLQEPESLKESLFSDQVVTPLDEKASSELIDELEGTMRDLKKLEEEIFKPKEVPLSESPESES